MGVPVLRGGAGGGGGGGAAPRGAAPPVARLPAAGPALQQVQAGAPPPSPRHRPLLTDGPLRQSSSISEPGSAGCAFAVVRFLQANAGSTHVVSADGGAVDPILNSPVLNRTNPYKSTRVARDGSAATPTAVVVAAHPPCTLQGEGTAACSRGGLCAASPAWAVAGAAGGDSGGWGPSGVGGPPAAVLRRMRSGAAQHCARGQVRVARRRLRRRGAPPGLRPTGGRLRILAARLVMLCSGLQPAWQLSCGAGAGEGSGRLAVAFRCLAGWALRAASRVFSWQ